MRTYTRKSARGGACMGRRAACGRGYPAKGLDGAGDGEALNGPLVRGLLPRVIHPPKWDALQFAPRVLQLSPPLFLPVCTLREPAV